jgi:hypothetical protein
MSGLDNNYYNYYITENIDEPIMKYVKPLIKTPEDLRNDEINIFGNFFGLVSERYTKYFNLLSIQIICTLMFAIFYYILLCNFDYNYYTNEQFLKKQILNNKFLSALIISINFQTTTAYVDVKCKSLISRLLTVAQILATFLITFLFLIY